MLTGTDRSHVILRPEDHAVLGESDFGMPGLVAIESAPSSACRRPAP
jgi:hypothetical protein